MTDAHHRLLELVDSVPDDWPGYPLTWIPLGDSTLGELIEAGVLESVDAPDPLPKAYPATNPGRRRTFIRRRK